jgi:hypothetical protein
MVELIKRAVYLTDENLPTLAAQRPSAYGDEWLKPGAWDVEAKGAAIPDAPRFSPYRKGQLAVSPFRRFALSPFRPFAVSPFRRFAHSPHRAPYRSLHRALATAACQPA